MCGLELEWWWQRVRYMVAVHAVWVAKSAERVRRRAVAAGRVKRERAVVVPIAVLRIGERVDQHAHGSGDAQCAGRMAVR